MVYLVRYMLDVFNGDDFVQILNIKPYIYVKTYIGVCINHTNAQCIHQVHVCMILYVYILACVCVCTCYSVCDKAYCSSSTSHCFIVPNRIITKSDVIHTALGCGTHLKCLKHHINYSLTGEHITPNNCSSIRWIQYTAWWYYYCDRLQTALCNRSTL